MSLLKRISVFSLVVTTVLWSVGFSFANVAKAATYSAGSLLAQQGVSGAAVYFVGNDGKKYVFPDAKTYFTWYSNFDNVKRVTVAELDQYPDGGAVTYRPGTRLVTHADTAKIYAIEPGGVARWIPDAATASNLYGANWASRVQDVIPGFFASSYNVGSDLGSTYPTGTLVQMGSTVYYIDGSTKRPFASADAFEANDFDWDDIVTVTSLAGYSDGSSITGEEASLSAFMGVSSGNGNNGAAGSLAVTLASDTPSSGVVVASAARVPFTKLNFVNTSNVAVTVDQVVVQRMGLAQDGAFASLDLLDGNMAPLNKSSKSLSSLHTATFNDDFVIGANSSMSVYVTANMASSLAAYAGETPVLGVSSVSLTNGTVSGAFPIGGNYQNLNGTLTIGRVTVASGGNNPSAATKEVGTKDYTATSLRITASSTEDVMVKQIVFTNNGSSDPEDVMNLRLYNANTGALLGTHATINDDKVVFNNLSVLIEKGKNITFDLKLDIESGSASTISYDIEKQADITVTGQTYGYNILPQYASANPYFNSNDITVGAGSVRVESVAVQPSEVTEGLDDVTLGKFKFVVKGEPVSISSIGWNFTFSTGVATSSTDGTLADLTSVKLVSAAGAIVAGPMDPIARQTTQVTNATATTTDTITIPVGEHTYTLKGNLNTNWTANSTLQSGVSFAAASIEGDVTGETITGQPGGETQANALTVKSASLNVSVSSDPASQTIVAGAQDFVAARFILDGSASGDTIKVTSIKPEVITTGNAFPGLISGWELWDGSTQLNISSESVTCSGNNCNTAAGSATTTLTLANDTLNIAPGATKTITVRVNVGTGATSGTFKVGLQNGSGGAGMTAVDSDAQTVTPSITTSQGQAMTLATGGTLNVALATDPVAANVVAATTVEVGRFTLQAKNENMNLNRFGFTLAAPAGGIAGGADEITTLYLYEQGGSTALGSVAVNGANATITPTGLTLAANESKTYVIKALWADLSSSSPASSGSGLNFSLTNIDVTGQSAGSSSVTVSGLGTAFNDFHVFKSLPTVTLMSSGDTIIGNSTVHSLAKVSVTADSKGPIGLFKMTFGVSTSTIVMSPTTSGWYLYESSSSGTLGNIIATGNDFSIGTQTNGSYLVQVWLDVNNDTSAAPALEHRVISAGETKYYTLRGTTSTGHDTTGGNEVISVGLAGDSAFAGTALEDTTAVDADDQDDFIWSDLNFDLYQTSSATNMVGWFNGYRVPGLDNNTTTNVNITD